MGIRIIVAAIWIVASIAASNVPASTPAEDYCTVANAIGGVCTDGLPGSTPAVTAGEPKAYCPRVQVQNGAPGTRRSSRNVGDGAGATPALSDSRQCTEATDTPVPFDAKRFPRA